MCTAGGGWAGRSPRRAPIPPRGPRRSDTTADHTPATCTSRRREPRAPASAAPTRTAGSAEVQDRAAARPSRGVELGARIEGELSDVGRRQRFTAGDRRRPRRLVEHDHQRRPPAGPCRPRHDADQRVCQAPFAGLVLIATGHRRTVGMGTPPGRVALLLDRRTDPLALQRRQHRTQPDTTVVGPEERQPPPGTLPTAGALAVRRSQVAPHRPGELVRRLRRCDDEQRARRGIVLHRREGGEMSRRHRAARQRRQRRRQPQDDRRSAGRPARVTSRHPRGPHQRTRRVTPRLLLQHGEQHRLRRLEHAAEASNFDQTLPGRADRPASADTSGNDADRQSASDPPIARASYICSILSSGSRSRGNGCARPARPEGSRPDLRRRSGRAHRPARTDPPSATRSACRSRGSPDRPAPP